MSTNSDPHTFAAAADSGQIDKVGQPSIRHPRRTFSPEIARQIRRENAALLAGTLVFWAFMGAAVGRAFRLW